jgi:hypothetical protein
MTLVRDWVDSTREVKCRKNDVGIPELRAVDPVVAIRL